MTKIINWIYTKFFHKHFDFWGADYAVSICEIVGNIYENPPLTNKKMEKKETQIHICMASDMHPYNCDGVFGGQCDHCERKVTEYHHPKNCALCEPKKESLTQITKKRK